MEQSFSMDLDDVLKEQEKKLEELSKNPPRDINFTYTKDELEKIISNYKMDLERRNKEIEKYSGKGTLIEDYAEEWNTHEAKPSEIVDLVDSYNKLTDKNNINNVEYIVRLINSKYNTVTKSYFISKYRPILIIKLFTNIVVTAKVENQAQPVLNAIFLGISIHQ